MKISYTKYTAFLQNPERYRLHYALGLTPEGDDAPTRMNHGRRRGRCFHELSEGKTREELVREYGEELVQRCEDMRAVVPDLGPLEMVEHSFEVPIGDGKHTIIGRLDHGFTFDDIFRIGDYKSTKGTRTKKEVQQYLDGLIVSTQPHFYLKAAAALGRPTDRFMFHVIFDRKDKDSKPKYFPLDLDPIGPAALERTMAEVYAACETIEFLRKEYGEEKPWPHSTNWPCCGDRFLCGYQGLCGRIIPKGCTPAGYTNRYKDLIQVEGV